MTTTMRTSNYPIPTNQFRGDSRRNEPSDALVPYEGYSQTPQELHGYSPNYDSYQPGSTRSDAIVPSQAVIASQTRAWASLTNGSKSSTSTALVRTKPRQPGPKSRPASSAVATKKKKAETHGEKERRRGTRRNAATTGAALGGAVVGGLVLGPVGVVLGGAGAGAATRAMVKRGEKRKDDRLAAKNLKFNAGGDHEFL